MEFDNDQWDKHGRQHSASRAAGVLEEKHSHKAVSIFVKQCASRVPLSSSLTGGERQCLWLVSMPIWKRKAQLAPAVGRKPCQPNRRKFNIVFRMFSPAALTMRYQSWVTRIAARAGLLLLLGPLVLILVFRFVPVPLTPLMVIRVAQGYELHHDWVAYDDIAPALAHAVVASEDNFFCREPFGFDGNALTEQIDAWWEGERPRGASTITMQTARNLLLWPGRDVVRKAVEAWLTVQIALLWPKERVLEVYLNSVEFGPGVYGAQAAAMHYFGRPAAQLTDDEASRLAVVLPDPLEWSAARPGPYVRERAVVIRHRIAQIGPLLGCTR
jgi:monofunctional biosynthetic peptidoglycan transglycosylase